MAEITRTIIYPLPTEWMVDEEDSAKSGICTYTGPDKITFWYKNYGTEESPSWHVEHCFPSSTPEERPMPKDCVSVELDADRFPMNAAAMWGGIEGPMLIETPAGPDTEPNPVLNDYYHFNEVFDLESFHYDFENNRWGSPEFSTVETETRQNNGEQTTFGWDWVRKTRNSLLAVSDNKVPSDAPDSIAAPWKEYRQKLRDLPDTWASVGEKTYLIVWPEEPNDNLA
jgi:hypothetical protein